MRSHGLILAVAALMATPVMAQDADRTEPAFPTGVKSAVIMLDGEVCEPLFPKTTGRRC